MLGTRLRDRALLPHGLLPMSATAKEGWEEDRLLAVVETTAVGLGQLIGSARDKPEESS